MIARKIKYKSNVATISYIVLALLYGCTLGNQIAEPTPDKRILTPVQVEENIKLVELNKDSLAAYTLSQHYKSVGDNSSKNQWLEKAATLGSKDAKLQYADYLLATAKGDKEVISKAIKILDENVNSNSPRVIDYVWLADLYAYQSHIDVDLEKALSLYRKSAAMGDKLSIEYVKIIENALANNEQSLISPKKADCGTGQTLHNPSSRYVINGAEVYDTLTDLTWQRCSVGQVWKERSGCEGPIQLFSFDKAQELSGKHWRVPARYELVTLVDRSCKAPSINKEVFPNMDLSKEMYWSNSTDERGNWFVLFYRGEVVSISDSHALMCSVRLVKNGR